MRLAGDACRTSPIRGCSTGTASLHAEMSIAAQYRAWQHRRTELRPGLTGWWQVNGRSDKPLHLHTDFDLYYLENYSFWLDLRILGRTLGAVVRGRGAY